MCNAFGHSVDCDCGFGGATYSAPPAAPSYRYNSLVEVARAVGHSLLVPGRTCWHCGAEIILYANAYGSFVIFETGPPDWEKHYCDGYEPVSSPRARLIAAREPAGGGNHAYKTGYRIPVPAGTPVTQPVDGQRIRAVIIKCPRFSGGEYTLFDGKGLFRVHCFGTFPVGAWIEGTIRRTAAGWRLENPISSWPEPPPEKTKGDAT
jgi:hypothetical protein